MSVITQHHQNSTEPVAVRRQRSRSFSTADLPPISPTAPIPLHSPPAPSSTIVTSPTSPGGSSLSASLKAFADLSLSPPTTLDSEEFQRAFHHARRSSFNGLSRPIAPSSTTATGFFDSTTTGESGVVANQNMTNLPPMSSSPTSSTVSDTLPTPPSSSPPKLSSSTNVKSGAAMSIKPSVTRPMTTNKPNNQLDGVCEKEELLFVDQDDNLTSDVRLGESAPATTAIFANGARWGWPQSTTTTTTTTTTTIDNPTSPLLGSSPPTTNFVGPPPVRRASLSTTSNMPPSMAPLSRVVSAGSAGAGGSATITGSTTGSGNVTKASDGFGLFRRLSVGGFGNKPKAPSPPSSTFGGSNNSSNNNNNMNVTNPQPVTQVPASIPTAAVEEGRGRKSLGTTTSTTKSKRRVSPFGERMLRDLGH
ncbi:hypothetical protein OIO90_006364 [Microbotryomycetes sp. JL221]|nr:hypothetical protein OIO90_006364 [Microbotryomycetes sp. JL221]